MHMPQHMRDPIITMTKLLCSKTQVQMNCNIPKITYTDLLFMPLRNRDLQSQKLHNTDLKQETRHGVNCSNFKPNASKQFINIEGNVSSSGMYEAHVRSSGKQFELDISKLWPKRNETCVKAQDYQVAVRHSDYQ